MDEKALYEAVKNFAEAFRSTPDDRINISVITTAKEKTLQVEVDTRKRHVGATSRRRAKAVILAVRVELSVLG